MYPELFVMRHGETEWNAEGRMQGALDSPLTALGRTQAQRQAAILSEIDLSGAVAFSSPQGRAFDTAAIALSGLMPYVRTDDRLGEIGVGDWAGRLIVELRPQDASSDALDLYAHAPGGEGFARLHTRCTAFLDDLTGPAVLVTHGITSRMLRAIALGCGIAGLAEMPCGQGVVYHLKNGVQKRLD